MPAAPVDNPVDDGWTSPWLAHAIAHRVAHASRTRGQEHHCNRAWGSRGPWLLKAIRAPFGTLRCSAFAILAVIREPSGTQLVARFALTARCAFGAQPRLPRSTQGHRTALADHAVFHCFRPVTHFLLLSSCRCWAGSGAGDKILRRAQAKSKSGPLVRLPQSRAGPRPCQSPFGLHPAPAVPFLP